MKTISIFFLAAMLTITSANAQYLFSNVALVNAHHRNIITFSLAAEANVRHYRVEASKDSISFEVIGTINSSGNSVQPKTYQYELFSTDYKYYRIGRVGMDGSLKYSDIMQYAHSTIEPVYKSDNQLNTHAVVNNK